MQKKDQKRMPLLEAMKHYAEQSVSVFDVPGHKRGKGVPLLSDYYGADLMRMDTNSSPILDNVSHPTGVIKEAQELLADAYGADAAFFITNGSTTAIHAMLMATLSPGDKVLMPTNIHKSALNGLILCGGIPVYVKPEICPEEGLTKNVSFNAVQNKLDEQPDIKAIFILNPTYFGYVADLKKIAHLCHERDVLLLTDEAHGAHFPFHSALPASSMTCDADISSISMHKTGGALTQASALLVRGSRINVNHVQQVINMLQSTSVSYLLMGSLDGARHHLTQNGQKQLETTLKLSHLARHMLEEIPGISVAYEKHFFDPTKLNINVSKLSLTGFQVYEQLWKNHNVQMELCETNHVLAVISLGDTEKDILHLVKAIKEIAGASPLLTQNKDRLLSQNLDVPVIGMAPRDAYFSEKELVPLDFAKGRIAGESIMAYPPGIPIVSPGELITESMINTLKDLKKKDAFIVDQIDQNLDNILTIKEPEPKGVETYA